MPAASRIWHKRPRSQAPLRRIAPLREGEVLAPSSAARGTSWGERQCGSSSPRPDTGARTDSLRPTCARSHRAQEAKDLASHRPLGTTRPRPPCPRQQSRRATTCPSSHARRSSPHYAPSRSSRWPHADPTHRVGPPSCFRTCVLPETLSATSDIVDVDSDDPTLTLGDAAQAIAVAGGGTPRLPLASICGFEPRQFDGAPHLVRPKTRSGGAPSQHSRGLCPRCAPGARSPTPQGHGTDPSSNRSPASFATISASRTTTTNRTTTRPGHLPRRRLRTLRPAERDSPRSTIYGDATCAPRGGENTQDFGGLPSYIREAERGPAHTGPRSSASAESP
jgi:hypothetical protein